MKGKDKCRILKQIRKKIADENDIPYVIEECPYKGECKGTCPKCEAEVRKMEEELSLRRRLGKGVALVGVAAGLMASTTACSPTEVVDDILTAVFGNFGNDDIMGEIEPPLTGDVWEGEPTTIDKIPEWEDYDGTDNASIN